MYILRLGVVSECYFQFVTLVGELNTVFPSKTDLWKSSLRSLRNTFVKDESKMLRYAWISTASELDTEGQDVFLNLARVHSLAEADILSPLVVRTIPFEQTPVAFPEPLRLGHAQCDEIVVQLIND